MKQTLSSLLVVLCISAVVTIASNMPIASASLMTITSVSPSVVPRMGACVTITGSGFSTQVYQPLYCSAQYNHNFYPTIVSDTQIVCCLDQDVNPGARNLYVWAKNLPQDVTIVTLYNGITYTSDAPVITDMYFGVNKLRFIDMCPECNDDCKAVTVVGNNFGPYASGFDYLVGGSPPVMSASIQTATSTMLTGVVTTQPLHKSSSVQIYLGFQNGAYAWGPQMKACWDLTSDFCLNYGTEICIPGQQSIDNTNSTMMKQFDVISNVGRVTYNDYEFSKIALNFALNKTSVQV